MEVKQRLEILEEKKRIIKQVCDNDICPQSGIYMFYRENENGENCCYIGQAKNLLNRTAQHLMLGKNPPHIDKSLYKHKLYSANNKFGWKVKVLRVCPIYVLDFWEQDYIQYFIERKWKVYNITGGGQINKAKDIGQRQQNKLKSYKNGKNKGYEKAREQVKVYFDKYLDYSIKGTPTKIKERKMQEFADFLADKTKAEEDSE